MSLVGALTKALKAGETAKKTAPFYSAVDEALANIARPKGTGAEFYTELTKQPGVKKAEIADRKLEQAFKAKGKITKEEAQQVLKENPPPKLQEREYNEKMVRDEEDIKEELAQERYGRSYRDLSQRDRNPIYDEAQRIMDTENGPIYGDYKTPGGENYREILLKLPGEDARVKKAEENVKRLKEAYRQDKTQSNYFAVQMAEQELSVAKIGQPAYRSAHWKEDPNVLAHMRVQDRVGPNGEKILHVEEIQSDWHQEGRKKGYKPNDYVEQSNALEDEFSKLGEKRFQLLKQAEEMPTHGPEFTALIDEANSITPQLMRLQEQRDNMRNLINYGVPDAPFKKNWHELAMKRLLNYAADNGYDSIAITPGVEQAKRYDLSKQVDELLYKQNPDGTYRLSAQARGSGNLIGDAIPAEKLEDYVGKDVAQKIIDNRGQERNLGGSGSVSQPKDIWGSLSGEGLQVGGEGMRGFYDKILPDYLNTFGKPYGSQVGVFDMPNPRKGLSITDVQKEAGITEQQWLDLPADEKMRLIDDMDAKAKAATMPLHSFPITPEMRESIKQKGLPLYQQIGIPTAGAGAASQMPEQMQEPMLEPEVKKADGGAINYNTAPDMSDGGRIIQGAPFKRGGKVKMTTNRDTMFLELSNKKLKRK